MHALLEFIDSGLFWGGVGLLLAAPALSGKLDMTLAGKILIGASICFIIGAWKTSLKMEHTFLRKAIILLVLAVIIGYTMHPYYLWIVQPNEHSRVMPETSKTTTSPPIPPTGKVTEGEKLKTPIPDPASILARMQENAGLIKGGRYDKNGRLIANDATARVVGTESRTKTGQNLHELFEKEFSRKAKLGSRDIPMKTGTTETRIFANEYLDFQANSKFLGFYIPESPYAYGICEDLSGKSEIIMKALEKTQVSGGYPADFHQTPAQDLVFSKKIYIYHEDNFSHRQIADLEQLYRSKGLLVIFRGRESLQSVWDNMDK